MQDRQKRGSAPEPFLSANLRPHYLPDRLENQSLDGRSPGGASPSPRPSPRLSWNGIYEQSADIHWTALDGQGVVVDLESGCYYSLNSLGVLIWAQLEQGRRPYEILQGLCDRFEVDPSLARSDMTTFIESLLHEGLIKSTHSPKKEESHD